MKTQNRTTRRMSLVIALCAPVTVKIFRTSIIAGMLAVMFASTTEVIAQRVDREALTRLNGVNTGNPLTPSPVGPNGRSEAKRQAAASRKGAGLNGLPRKKAIVGTWLETVTQSGEGAPPPFKSLGTFTEDGSLVVADQGRDTTALPFVFSPGHGAWVHLQGRTFAWAVIELVTDLNGNLAGIVKIRGEYTVNESGNEYTGHFKAELFDPVGNPVFSVEGTNEGQRIQVEPLP